jgi:hypothetical protein
VRSREEREWEHLRTNNPSFCRPVSNAWAVLLRMKTRDVGSVGTIPVA